MPAVHDAERTRRGGNLGHLPVAGDGVPRPCHQVIHRDAHLDRVPHQRQLGTQQVGQLAEHPQRLPLLLDLRLPQRVAQLDRRRMAR